MMALDDGATDRQANPHTATLRRVKRIEKFLHTLRFETRTGVPHRQAYAVVLVPFGSDQQLSRSIVDVAHRVCGVQEQVQDDLLKLNTIAGDRRKVARKFLSQDDLAPLQFAQ